MKKLQLGGRMRSALRGVMPARLKISKRRGDFKPLEHGGLIAKCSRDWPQEPEFVEQWKALRARNAWATPFQGPAWQSAVVDEFVPAGQFRLVTVHRGAELLAVLPMGLNTKSMLETPGYYVTDLMNPLVDLDHSAACWEIMLGLLKSLWDWSVGGIVLRHIRGDWVGKPGLIDGAAKAGFTLKESLTQCGSELALPPTWEKYLEVIHGHDRKELKRKIKNAQTKGRAKWVNPVPAEDFAGALERALAGLRKSESVKAEFSEEILAGFLRRVAPKLHEQGDFSLAELWIEDRPVAWLMEIHTAGGPMLYNTAYEFSMRQWSPGAVAFGLFIADAIKGERATLNLLRGQEDYKRHLGAGVWELKKIVLRPVKV